ncbi:hypothetical protein TNCV_4298221 [Trichonephila clavipes]|nr:hypothetical protein TNCV_4298221 [Trichonephila clavipes]
MRSARDQSPSLPIDVLGISLQRVPHVEAWRVGCHLSSPPRHSTGVPNDTVWGCAPQFEKRCSRVDDPLEFVAHVQIIPQTFLWGIFTDPSLFENPHSIKRPFFLYQIIYPLNCRCIPTISWPSRILVISPPMGDNFWNV